MCGRFQLSVKGKEISERFNTEVFDERYKPSFNCAPGQLLPVITNLDVTKVQLFKWGLVPYWAKDTRAAFKMINSRSETLSEKPAFKQAFKQRRCLIPANGFYEWKKATVKQPYRIFLKSNAVFAMAGIWEQWKQTDGHLLFTFSIITTRANRLIEGLHDRMPVILSPENEQEWLNETDEKRLESLLKPFPEEEMELHAVSSRVNHVSQDDARLIEPTDDLSEGLFG